MREFVRSLHMSDVLEDEEVDSKGKMLRSSWVH